MAEDYRNLVEIPERGFHYFRHYFIPHESNNHHPLVVRPNALKVYSALLIGVKLFLVLFLYSAYPSEAQFAELTASKVFELTNASRVENGQSALRLNASLTRSAQAKAQDMLRQGYFDHTSPDGKKFWQWIKEAGFSYSTAGENLAMDFTTAESAHRAFMASVSHRNNILKPGYTDIGLAVVEGTMNGRSTTILVEHFGTPLTQKQVALQPAQPKPAVNQPAAPPATTKTAQTKPAYAAALVGKSEEEFVLLPNSEVTAWLDFKNTGSAVWRNDRDHFIALNLANPPGRTSAFAHPSWIKPYRPAILSQRTVKPGQVGRFQFTIRAPASLITGNESFGLVAENLTWINGASATVPIRVVGAQPAVAAGETPPQPQEAVRQQFNTTAVEVANPETQPSIQPVEQPVPLVVALPSQPDWRQQVVAWTIRLFWGFLIFLSVSLLLTIFVRIRIQHRHVILQTLLVITITAFMLLVRFHFAERITQILVT